MATTNKNIATNNIFEEIKNQHSKFLAQYSKFITP